MASRANELLLCPENKNRYDSADIKSIFEYAKQLEGKTFEDILRNNGLSDDDVEFLKEKSMTNKGLLGNLIEEAWFGYPANSMQDADFDEVDAELKSTPFEGSGSKIRPGETVSVTQIDFTKPQEEDFYKSHAWKKIQMILLVYYLREKQRASILKSKLFYRIHYVFMIKPTQVDLAIIEADYKYLYGFIIRGEAEKLERSHGKYLGVAPKSNKNEEVLQYYGDHKPVHKKSFVLKKPYLRFILRVAADIEEDCGSIIRDVSELQTDTMDAILEKRLSSYIGMEINVIWNMVKTSDETNNLPGIADNGVFHIRNHASKSFYVINGVSYGNGSLSDTDELPNGDRITKQAYWLNRSYIESQLRPDLVMQYD